MTRLYQVMLVDDEASALDILSDYIHRAQLGFHVVAKAQGAEDAIFSLKVTKPDLIITDIRMPVTDGLQMLDLIHQTGWKDQAAIISGYDDFEYARQAIRLGVVEYLLKPIFPEDIRMLLERTQSRFEDNQAEMDKLRREIQTELQVKTAVNDHEDNILPTYILQAKNYIMEHYEEPLTLTQVARAAAVNPTYLSASFVKHCGINFLEYLTNYRMIKAKELLKQTNLQIQEIAIQVGYNDIAYFNRVFRRETAQTPGACRANFRKSETPPILPTSGGK
ncbi:MAG TPA: hypothetical protein DDW50_18650 [Firmicutes bacterium]|nr:hypothetical protein [Bacillota bacterium]